MISPGRAGYGSPVPVSPVLRFGVDGSDRLHDRRERTVKEWETLAVCLDCLYTAANGAPDWDGYGESGHAERYAQAAERHGSELVAACSDETHPPECVRDGFSWNACGWCGDTLGGDRFCASVAVID